MFTLLYLRQKIPNAHQLSYPLESLVSGSSERCEYHLPR